MITYRKATTDDIRPAFDLIEKVWKDSGFGKFDVLQKSVTQNAEEFEKYASGEHIMFVAQADKSIVGVIGADDTGFIHELFIDGAFERRGVATELLSRVVCELKIRGIDVIRLGSSRRAITFYEKYGFIKTGEEQLINGFVTTPMEYKPNEIWDILNENGNKTGRLHERGKPMASGDYHIIVHVWKRNPKGEWLIDKRTPRYGNGELDGKWETTGGCVIAGEDSFTAALRETKEELGIDLDPKKGVLFNRFARLGSNGHTWFEDIWVFEFDEPIGSVAYDGSEVCDAMWATADKIREMMSSGEFLSEWFYPYLNEMFEKWGAVK